MAEDVECGIRATCREREHISAYFARYIDWQTAIEAGNGERCERLDGECREMWNNIIKNDFKCPGVIPLGEPSKQAYELLKRGHSADHCTSYLFWFIVDSVGLFNKNYRIHTAYHKKYTITDDIDNLRTKFGVVTLETQPIFLNYEERRMEFNAGKSKWDRDYCHNSFSELVEDIRNDIVELFAILDEFAYHPREAYLEITFEEIYTKYELRICQQLDHLRANAMKCLAFWKNESGFWDEKFVNEIL